jgi:HPt (histidine-containing phosphotransfer) domain-containing protein
MPEPATNVLDQATFEDLLDSVGGDTEFLAELVDTYLADAPEQIAALREAISASDVAAVVRPAHTLKSASASLAALGLAEQCRRLELSATAGSFAGAHDAIEAISDEFARVAEALEQAKAGVA